MQYLENFEVNYQSPIPALSFGQKKKFLLAFGLATDCRLILFDEPTNGLDIPSKSQFRKVLAAEFSPNRLIIISTHQARDLENIIDAVVILDDGDVVFNRSLAEVADRLEIRLQPDPPDPQSALHAEEVPGGFAVISSRQGADATPIDLETLFNAVIANHHTISRVFTQEDTHV